MVSDSIIRSNSKRAFMFQYIESQWKYSLDTRWMKAKRISLKFNLDTKNVNSISPKNTIKVLVVLGEHVQKILAVYLSCFPIHFISFKMENLSEYFKGEKIYIQRQIDSQIITKVCFD